jgi:putative ABC transport system permease protein
MTTLWHDLVYGARMLRKQPGFTALAVLTLALGIGANTAIFSIVDWMLLRPLPVSHPEQVTFLAMQQEGHFSNGFSIPDLLDIQNQSTSVFSDVAGDGIGLSGGLTADGKTQPIQIGYVTGNFFRLTGIKPHLGRFILPSEGAVAGADPVIVLSYSYWSTRFGSDPGIIGKKIAFDGHPVTVIGIAPKGFRGLISLLETQGYLPLGMQAVDGSRPPDFMTNRGSRSVLIAARLKDGVSIEQARSVLSVISTRLSDQYPKTNHGMNLGAWPLGPQGPIANPSSSPFRSLGVVFMSLALLVLVLACLNVANMLLVRASGRQREMAVRAALGAARGRLIRQLLSESLVLAAVGCVAGIYLGMVASRALSSLNLMTSFPIVLDFHFDWRVFTYAFAMAILTGFLAGIVPALRASRINLSGVLHEGDRTSTGGHQRFRSSLVAAQVAGSLMLLVIAGLFVRSLSNVHLADLGFDPQHVLNLTLDPHEIGYNETQGRDFDRQLLTRVRSIPGIQSASLAQTVPLGEIEFGDRIEVDGYQAPTGQSQPEAGYNFVSSGYFETLGLHILHGRGITDADEQNSQLVAVINEAMAQQFWPGQDPVGRHFVCMFEGHGTDLEAARKHPLEIVGVVKNSKTGNLVEAPSPYFYAPLTQHYASLATLQFRAMGAPESMAQITEQTIESLAPSMPVYGVQTMSSALRSLNGLFLFQFGAGLAASLGLIGLILATVGVYGVVSYSASQRTREIGIRMALGARSGTVLLMICRQGMVIIGIGLMIGLFAAFGLGRVVGSFLIGVAPTDPITYATVTLGLLFVGVSACYVPARRAAKVDPMVALRHE